jgi:hypothetical protein
MKLTERRMELSIKLVTQPLPGIWARVLVLVVFIVAVLVIWRIGYGPAAIPLIFSVGLAGAQVARALLHGSTRSPLPAAGFPHAG